MRGCYVRSVTARRYEVLCGNSMYTVSADPPQKIFPKESEAHDCNPGT